MNHIEFASALPKDIHEKRLKKALTLIAKHEKVKSGWGVGVSFVSPKRMAVLNRVYRGKNKETDVLSFAPDLETLAPKAKAIERSYLGDIVICTAFAKREAKRRGMSPEEELIRLFVHGVLHLRGYDHANEDDEIKMFEIQERIVEKSLK